MQDSADPATTRAQARRTRPDPTDLDRAAKLLASASRPLILAGGGVHISDAHDALLALAEEQGIPVAHTLSGKGAIACTHALWAGLFGRYDRIANALIAESDCILVVGCKLGEIATKRFSLFTPDKPLIHIEIDPTEIGRTTRTEIALAGDARLALLDLGATLGDGRSRAAARAEWTAAVPRRMKAWREAARERIDSNETPINVGRLMRELNAVMPGDGIVVADGGFAAHWGGLFFDTKSAGRRFLPDRGFASIGYGRRVLSMTGDGGFNMSLAFVILHLTFPVVLWLIARNATIALAASFMLYLMVQLYSWHWPAWPTGESISIRLRGRYSSSSKKGREPCGDGSRCALGPWQSIPHLKVDDLAPGGYAADRATVRQKKTGRPVKFELTESTRQAIDDYLRLTGKKSGEYLFTGRRPSGHMTTRQYARRLSRWLADIGLDPHFIGTHSLRRTKATLIYRHTGNLRAVQLLLGHTKIESTVRLSRHPSRRCPRDSRIS